MTTERDKRSYPKKVHAYTTVALLTRANVVAFVDRQIPAMLVGPIKQDFNLSDSQMALLLGAAFSVSYALMALPIGYAVDRLRRKDVLGSALLVWSCMTLSAIFANSYAKLFGVRMGVAAGDAAFAPSSVSLVGDSFAEAERGRALGMTTAGIYIGVGISFWGGGALIDYLTAIGGLTIPIVGYVKPWQAVFLMSGIPGLLLALAVFLLPEPPRAISTVAGHNNAGESDLRSHLSAHRVTLGLMFGGLIFMALIFYSFAAWAPSMMVRTFGLSIAEVGKSLGVITITSSIAGTIVAGMSVDWLSKKGYRDAPIRVAMCACLLALPAIVSAPLMGSLTLCWLLLGVYLMFISGWATLGLLAVSGVSSDGIKGRMTSIFTLVMMIGSATMGPQLTAFFTDFVFVDESKLNWSIALTAALTLPIAALFFRACMPHYADSVERLRQ
jgi:MFS family permease